jgi:L-rhamnose 1-dehydrogenase
MSAVANRKRKQPPTRPRQRGHQTTLTVHGARVLVTGGSRGIGLAYAEALRQAGCSVVINHLHDGEKAHRECQRLNGANPFYEIEADVGSPSAARAMVHRAAKLLGGLDILVSNAGICRFVPFLELDDATWQRHLDVNLSGGFWVAQTAAQIMVKGGTGGRIIFTTSVGSFRSNGTQTHYCSTKGGLRSLAQGMALELAPHGITVNCIAPGWVHTDINHEHSTDEDKVSSWLAGHCPVGRLGQPDDLKSAVVFLASKEAAYITGTTVCVDGGWNAQL